MSGEVAINGHVLARGEYSKVGAYVQQDDSLMEVMSPKETFEFSCRVRLGLSEKETNEHVKFLIERLALEECQD